ncbi:Tat pathway signal protein [Krasilnikovia sp. M28-CT-15]|uniref:Tat pathway signal protein n=1 Tax=Krasilnikovia sp. M28-CT-15 TaxID=3373540 RepID=UPI00399D4C22
MTNTKLLSVIAAAELTHGQVARDIHRIAGEIADDGSAPADVAGIGRSHVSHWVAGVTPSGRLPALLCEVLSRRLGRTVTPEEIGLPSAPPSAGGTLGWEADTLVSLRDLGGAYVDAARRRVLATAAYSLAALTLPEPAWWARMAALVRAPSEGAQVGRGDVAAVREAVALFSRMDQRRGGGHARSAVVQYLTSDVAAYLRGRYSDDGVRRDMFSTGSELAYLSGSMAFDNGEHAAAQGFFNVAVKLAAEADDPAIAAHVLRAMAHQAVDLGHYREAQMLAAASMERHRYTAACHRERALLGVVNARALAAGKQARGAAQALLRAESDLRNAEPGDDEPQRVFFFAEASLAHETACTLRDMGDLRGAVQQFRRSVRTRRASSFTRTHAVTLGYLGAVQARQGELEAACRTWSKALDAMEGVRSGRTRQVAATVRGTLSPLRGRRIRLIHEVDARAGCYLAAHS